MNERKLRGRRGSKGSRRTEGRTIRDRRCRFEPLEDRRVLAAPTLAAIGDVTLFSGSPLWIPLDGFDADGDSLTFLAQSDNAQVQTSIPQGNRSMKITVSKADGGEGDGPIQGEMILQLFEDRVPRATQQIIDLAEAGFYDGIIFHRVIDSFMIQGGDPTGTGSGGSPLPDFDDQFDVDLQHNRSGILSMAKSKDDTNNSQFFITEGPARHLDYNHTIFGLLVEGESVREAISNVLTGDSDRPLTDVVMQSVEIFVDQENGVLMLKAPQGYSGEANITITLVDDQGNQYPQTPFHVTITPDPDIYVGFNSEPFLEDIPEVRTTVDTPTTFDVGYLDVEGDTGFIFDEWFLAETEVYNFNRYLPIISHADLRYQTDPNTGETTVTPTNGLVGIHPIVVSAVFDYDWYPGEPLYETPDARVDYQVVPVFIAPETAPAASLDMTLVLGATPTSEMGEVESLPTDAWIDEWDSFAVEVWAKIDSTDQFGVHTVTTDLSYNQDLFTAKQIEYGPAFFQQRTGLINTAEGVVENLGGTTPVLTINQHLGYRHEIYGPDYAFDPTDVNLYGDNEYLLVARVYFSPYRGSNAPGVPHPGPGKYAEPITDLAFSFENAAVKWSSVDATNLTTRDLQNAQLWPMLYDYNDDGRVSVTDLGYFAGGYGKYVTDPTAGWAMPGDFDHSGGVSITDLGYFAGNYRRTKDSSGRSVYPSNFPADWLAPQEGAAVAGAAAPTTSGLLPRLKPRLAAGLAAGVTSGDDSQSSDDADASNNATGDTSTPQVDLAYQDAFVGPRRPEGDSTTPRRTRAAVDWLMMEYGRPK